MGTPYKTARVRRLFENAFVRFEDHAVRAPGGREFSHAVVVAGPSCRIVPVAADGRIIITREWRYPTRVWNYELPGGGNGGLSPTAAARKELKEETGYLARRFEKLGKFVAYSGLSTDWCYAFIATGLRQVRQELEISERITTRAITWNELERMIANNEFRDGLSLATLMMARDRLWKSGISGATGAKRSERAR